jgi:hypothetical protein
MSERENTPEPSEAPPVREQIIDNIIAYLLKNATPLRGREIPLGV